MIIIERLVGKSDRYLSEQMTVTLSLVVNAISQRIN